MKCAPCSEKKCIKGKDCTDITAKVKAKYVGEDFKILRVADELIENYYMQKTRLEEILYFAKEMDYKKLGLAFCSGLKDEAEIIDQILSKEFKVFSAICKVCGISKSDFQLKSNPKDGRISCNPIGQAEILNRKKTDLNIVVGLCLGHDILFTKHSKALVTTLVVKDRVLAHNPIGAIYSGFYRKKRFHLEK
ncbi:MAG: DUF1847 domain-containing protein [Thermodesulfobacteriota bacterium]